MKRLINLYHAKKIILEDITVDDAYLEVVDGKFGKVYTELPEGFDGVEVIDYSHATLAPGFVETHIHGYRGNDVMDANFDGVKAMAKGLIETGVTSWLPTTLTSSTESLNEVCQLIGEHYQAAEGAKIQGIFLEGPYFTEKHKGAQNPAYMSDPIIEQLAHWQALSGGIVKKIAIAPERNGVAEFTEYAVNHGIKIGLAHSDATYAQAEAAVQKGASIFIHTYNGMSGLHHREPGMVGAAMTQPNVYAEVIADGHHVHPKAIDVLVKVRGVDQMILITDCMRAGGLGDCMSTLGEFEVEVKDGQARLVNGGSLAGSVLEMITAVKNVVNWNIVTLEEAVKMASLNPAKSVGIDDVCGAIREGLAADFLVINDAIDLEATYVDGTLQYVKES